MDVEEETTLALPTADELTAQSARFVGRWNPVTREYEKKIDPMTGEEIDVVSSSSLSEGHSILDQMRSKLKLTPEEIEKNRREWEKYALLTTGIYVPATKEDEKNPDVLVDFKPMVPGGVEERVKYILPDPRNPEHREILFRQRNINMYVKDDSKNAISEREAAVEGSKVPFSIDMLQFRTKFGITNVKRMAISGAVLNSMITMSAQSVRDILREQCLVPIVVKTPLLVRMINQQALPLCISSFNLIRYYMMICTTLPSKFEKMGPSLSASDHLRPGADIPKELEFVTEWKEEDVLRFMQRVNDLKSNFTERMVVFLTTEAKRFNATESLARLAEITEKPSTQEDCLTYLQEIAVRMSEETGQGDTLQRMISTLNVKQAVNRLEEETGATEENIRMWIMYQRNCAAQASLSNFFKAVTDLVVAYGVKMELPTPSEGQHPVQAWVETVSGNTMFLHDYWLLLVQRTDEYIVILETFILMNAYTVIPMHYEQPVLGPDGNVVGKRGVDVWKEMRTIPNIAPDHPVSIPTRAEGTSSTEERLGSNPAHVSVFEAMRLLTNGMMDDGPRTIAQQTQLSLADTIERRGLDREAFLKHKDDSPRVYSFDSEGLSTLPSLFALQQSVLHTVFLIEEKDDRANYEEIQTIYNKNVKEQIDMAKARGERITFVTRTGETVSSFEDKKRRGRS